MWGNITKKKGPITYLIRGPKNCEGTLPNTTESNISENGFT